jgi:hypothetical protein
VTRLQLLMLSIAAVMAVAAGLLWRPSLRIVYNATDSAPLGWYRVQPTTHLDVGDYVVAALPAPFAFDENTVGAAIVNACDAAFDWKRGSQLAALIGKNAYDELLHQLRSQEPIVPKSEQKADDALQSRMAENLWRGARLVAQKGCEDPEVQALVRTSEEENQ